jgi:hypothetical protein
MRKELKNGLLILFFMGVLIAPTGFAAEKYDVTAVEVFDPLGIITGDFIGRFVSEGTVNCPGHEPVLNPNLPPCPAGSRTHIRTAVIETRVDSADERVAGLMTVQLNANWNANFEGPLYGTFTILLDAGGSWAGTYEGKRTFDSTLWVWKGTLHVRGTGFGGLVDGMKMMAEDELESIFPMPIAYIGNIEGRIIDPN